MVLSNTLHVFIIHLQCYCHRIIVGLQIKVWIQVLYNSLDFRAWHSCANRLLFSTFLLACLRSILHVGLWCGAICRTCLVVCAKDFFAWLRSLFSPNACLCGCWGKYSGILNYHQETSRMGGEICCSLITFFLSCSLVVFFKYCMYRLCL